jgi:hypothetical protein
VSPILTRPIREQLEHDRIIRQLQARYKRKHDVAINPGPEQNEAVKVGELSVYPDLILFSQGRGRKLEGTVEVETSESVHLLEARAEWGVFTKLGVPLHLYVPPQSLETARRLCQEHGFEVGEIWTYHQAMDQVRFTQVYRAPAPAPVRAAAPRPASKPPVSKAKTRAPAARPAKSVRRTALTGRPGAKTRPARPAGKRTAAARTSRPVKKAAAAKRR